MSTLLLQEPGPLRLQSWSLRDCAGVTNRSIESFGYFPMLCLLDLRGTKVEPCWSAYRLLNWDRGHVLPSREHFDFFWPQPQFGIPALIQRLKPTAYSNGTGDHGPGNKPPVPWIIHIDRQYPSDWGLNRVPYWKPAPSTNHLPWYSYDHSEYYSDGCYLDGYYSDGYDMDMLGEDGLSIDSDNSGNDSDSGESLGEAEELSQSEFDPSSPLGPTSSIFEGDEPSSTLSVMDPIFT
ncbi:unnamed protein product [Rhizoctonia solani]|uniref:Uncharacterized protein n=1 Tax=Rhizoctonia solani TaxID=456999 RepID=A0A8H3HX41_9AGAM|nr:unnamed protein product [Rhizoctonia solani]